MQFFVIILNQALVLFRFGLFESLGWDLFGFRGFFGFFFFWGFFGSIRTRNKYLSSYEPVAALQHEEFRWEQAEKEPDEESFLSPKTSKTYRITFFMVLGYFLLLLGSEKYSCSFLLLKGPQLQGWRFFLSLSPKRSQLKYRNMLTKHSLAKGKSNSLQRYFGLFH